MWWLVVAIVLIATTSSAGEVRRLRLCADPSNLPFSSRDAGEPGFEVEIARAIAAALEAELTVHWVPTAREIIVLRQLYERRCDLVMGFPINASFMDDKPRLSLSTPYYVMRQVVVASSVGGVRSLEDLKSRVVGVQAMTLSDQLVYGRGYNRKVYVTPDETFEALLRGEVDAVVMESAARGLVRHAERRLRRDRDRRCRSRSPERRRRPQSGSGPQGVGGPRHPAAGGHDAPGHARTLRDHAGPGSAAGGDPEPGASRRAVDVPHAVLAMPWHRRQGNPGRLESPGVQGQRGGLRSSRPDRAARHRHDTVEGPDQRGRHPRHRALRQAARDGLRAPVVNGGPRNGPPYPPTARRAPAKPGRASITPS